VNPLGGGETKLRELVIIVGIAGDFFSVRRSTFGNSPIFPELVVTVTSNLQTIPTYPSIDLIRQGCG
jgi:hypothetical protein